MTISLEDSVWIRSYTVWSQLAGEPPSWGAASHGPALDHDAHHGDPMHRDRDARPAASPQGSALT